MSLQISNITIRKKFQGNKLGALLKSQGADTNINVNDDKNISNISSVKIEKDENEKLNREMEALAKDFNVIRENEEKLMKDLEQKKIDLIKLEEEKETLAQELNFSRSKIKSFKKEVNDLKKEKDIKHKYY
jgi:chromosome segregation ATPase